MIPHDIPWLVGNPSWQKIEPGLAPKDHQFRFSRKIQGLSLHHFLTDHPRFFRKPATSRAKQKIRLKKVGHSKELRIFCSLGLSSCYKLYNVLVGATITSPQKKYKKDWILDVMSFGDDATMSLCNAFLPMLPPGTMNTMNSQTSPVKSWYTKLKHGGLKRNSCVMNISGQIIIFHQPRFPWNKGNSHPKPPFGGNRSSEVAIIWPNSLHFHLQERNWLHIFASKDMAARNPRYPSSGDSENGTAG